MLELRKDGELIELVPEGGWVRLPNGIVFSPAEAGWSDDDGYSLVAHEPELEPEPEPEPVHLKAYAANARWLREENGLIFGPYVVATDDRSKLLILGARVKADIDPDFTTKFKVADGNFVEIDAATIVGISDALLEHVDSGFQLEAQVSAQIDAGTITTTTQIDEVFFGPSE